MIDWASVLVPVRHEREIAGGFRLDVDEDGSAVRTLKWKPVQGSWEDSVQVRSHHDEGGAWWFVYVSGNPSKWYQGHNLAGSEDPGLIWQFGRDVLEQLKMKPDAGRSWYLNRLDVARMYELGADSNVHRWLESAEKGVTMKHRGRGALDRGTLYYGKRSRRVSVKAYAKGIEIKAHPPRCGEIMKNALLRYAAGKLRIEVTARRMHLADKKIRNLEHVTMDRVTELYSSQIEKLNLDTRQVIDAAELAELSCHQRGLYSMWLAGVRLDRVYSRSTFYRHRRFFLTHGIDIYAKPPEGGEVIPMLRELVAEPARVPDWLEETIWKAA